MPKTIAASAHKAQQPAILHQNLSRRARLATRRRRALRAVAGSRRKLGVLMALRPQVKVFFERFVLRARSRRREQPGCRAKTNATVFGAPPVQCFAGGLFARLRELRWLAGVLRGRPVA